MIAKTTPRFEHITVTELHPTFAAEISGVDFSFPISEEIFQEILAAVTKVCPYSYFVVDFCSFAT